MKTFAIIPAGGKGTRLGTSTPKQYLKVLGKEIIAYTLQVFQDCELIDEIVIAAEERYFQTLETLVGKFNLTKVKNIVKGGATRQDSVYNALISLEADDTDIVAVHDAARPLLSREILRRAVEKARKVKSVVVAVKMRDTVLEGEEKVENYLERERIYAVQTPQVFEYSLLKKAMDKAREENFIGTDESSLVYRASNEVFICEGSSENFKITTETDLKLFEYFLNLKIK